ncbi:hypothetical protein [Tessaracoccus sp. G1721]
MSGAAWRRLGRILARPSTEVQGDAVAVAVVAGAVAAASILVALRTVGQERTYGRFLTTTVATASYDIRDATGALLARSGEDEIVELHVVRHLRQLAALRAQGKPGRLAARVEIFTGLRAFSDDFDDPRYARATVVVARAGVARALLRLGFREAPAPRLDLANRAEKWVLGLRSGAPSGLPDCLVVMPRAQWEHPRTRSLLDEWIRRWRAD